MDTLFCWVETAYSLADVDGKSMTEVETAYLSLERGLSLVSEAKAHVHQLQRKAEVSTEEVAKARALYLAVCKKLHLKKSRLIVQSVQSCTD